MSLQLENINLEFYEYKARSKASEWVYIFALYWIHTAVRKIEREKKHGLSKNWDLKIEKASSSHDYKEQSLSF